METAIININVNLGRNNFVRVPYKEYHITGSERIMIRRSYDSLYRRRVFKIFVEKQWYKKDSEILLGEVESIQLVLDKPAGFGVNIRMESKYKTLQTLSAYKKSPIPKNLKYSEYIYKITLSFKYIYLIFEDLSLGRPAARTLIDNFLIKNEIISVRDKLF